MNKERDEEYEVIDKRNPAFLRLKEDEKLLEKEKKKTNPDPVFIEYLENDISFLKQGLERVKQVTK